MTTSLPIRHLWRPALLLATGPFLLAQEADQRRVLPVATVTVERQETFSFPAHYTGRWETKRTSPLGFELGGTVTRLLADEGQAVPAGALLAEVDTLRLRARLAEVNAALTEASAALELASLTLQRIEEAAARGAVAPQRRDEATQERALRAATVERFTRQLESVEADLAKARLSAPYAGIITRRWVDEGQVVAGGAPIVTLQEAEAWELRVGLSGRRSQSISVGESVAVEVNGSSQTGKIVRIVPERDSATRTIDAIVSVNEIAPGIRAGDLATVAFAVTREASGFWLPLAALTEDVRGLWAVYAAVPTEEPGIFTLQRRSLNVIHLEGDRAYVAGPVATGERIVASGSHRIVDGQRVRLVADEIAQR